MKTAPRLPKTRLPSPYHRLHALLHTVRRIGEREDALCEMLHELKNSRGVSEKQAQDLRGILERLPSQDYLDDLHLVTDALDQSEVLGRSTPKLLVGSASDLRGAAGRRGTSAKTPPAKSKVSRRQTSK